MFPLTEAQLEETFRKHLFPTFKQIVDLVSVAGRQTGRVLICREKFSALFQFKFILKTFTGPKFLCSSSSATAVPIIHMY